MKAYDAIEECGSSTGGSYAPDASDDAGLIAVTLSFYLWDSMVGTSPDLIVEPPLVGQPPSAITSTPGVCGGAARIQGTRIPVWTLERFRQLGATDENLLAYYPSLTRGAIRAAKRYAASHEDEIAAAILQNEAPVE